MFVFRIHGCLYEWVFKLGTEWNEVLLLAHITTVWWKRTGGGYLQKKSKSEPVLLLVRMPHCYIRYGEAVGWQDGRLAVWNNSMSIQILHWKQPSELRAGKEESSDCRSQKCKPYNFRWQNAASEGTSGRKEWEVVLFFFKPLYQPWLPPLCMLTLADRVCSDQSTDKSVL